MASNKPRISAVILSQGIKTKSRQFDLINVFNMIYSDKIEGTLDLFITVIGEYFNPGTKIDFKIKVYYNDTELVSDPPKQSKVVEDYGNIICRAELKNHIPLKQGNYKVVVTFINIAESHASLTVL